MPVVSGDAISIVRYVTLACTEIDCLQCVHPFLLFADKQVKLKLKETPEDVFAKFFFNPVSSTLKSTLNSTSFVFFKKYEVQNRCFFFIMNVKLKVRRQEGYIFTKNILTVTLYSYIKK
jgi:hypothetical protein